MTDTSMLNLNVTEMFKTLLGDIFGEHAEGIKESKSRLGTKLILKGVEGGGGIGHRGRGKGGGRANDDGDDCRLHYWNELNKNMRLAVFVVNLFGLGVRVKNVTI